MAHIFQVIGFVLGVGGICGLLWLLWHDLTGEDEPKSKPKTPDPKHPTHHVR